jgi:hypothetical protein
LKSIKIFILIEKDLEEIKNNVAIEEINRFNKTLNKGLFYFTKN